VNGRSRDRESRLIYCVQASSVKAYSEGTRLGGSFSLMSVNCLVNRMSELIHPKVQGFLVLVRWEGRRKDRSISR